jgi:prepilin peptidase CpaA
MTTMNQEFVYPIAASVVALIGAAFDVKSRRIPNKLTGPALLFGMALHLTLGGWHSLLSCIAAGLICGAVFLVFYLAGGMGAGDVKLIAAVGCLAGLTNTAYLLVLTALAGGVMAIGLALVRGRLKETLMNVGALASHHKSAGLTAHPELNVRNASTLRLPYGLAIAAGCTITLYLQGFAR